MEAEGDGCTLWFDGWGDVSWRHCCDAHDLAYAGGFDKIGADLDLATCVAQTGNGVVGLIMLAGLTLFGWLFYRVRRQQ